jgi:hypothetical protein
MAAHTSGASGLLEAYNGTCRSNRYRPIHPRRPSKSLSMPPRDCTAQQDQRRRSWPSSHWPPLFRTPLALKPPQIIIELSAQTTECPLRPEGAPMADTGDQVSVLDYRWRRHSDSCFQPPARPK